MTGRPAGVGERALVDLHDVAPAQLGQVPDHRVPDDPGPDHDDVGALGQVAHGVSPSGRSGSSRWVGAGRRRPPNLAARPSPVVHDAGGHRIMGHWPAAPTVLVSGSPARRHFATGTARSEDRPVAPRGPALARRPAMRALKRSATSRTVAPTSSSVPGTGEAVARAVAVERGHDRAGRPADRGGDRRDAVVELLGRPHEARRPGSPPGDAGSRAGAVTVRAVKASQRSGEVGVDLARAGDGPAARARTRRRGAGAGCRSSRGAGPRAWPRRGRGTRPRRRRGPRCPTVSRTSSTSSTRNGRAAATRPDDGSTAVGELGHRRADAVGPPSPMRVDRPQRLERAEEAGDGARGQVDARGATSLMPAGPVATARSTGRPARSTARWTPPAISRSRRASRPCGG